MDTQGLKDLIDRFIDWKPEGREQIPHYTHNEFLNELESFKKKEEELLVLAKRYGAGSEARIHNYVITLILEPLIGRMRYGKREG